MRVTQRDIQRESVCVCDRESVCVGVRACDSQRFGEKVCVFERERTGASNPWIPIARDTLCLCVRERERAGVCMCERETEFECVRVT